MTISHESDPHSNEYFDNLTPASIWVLEKFNDLEYKLLQSVNDFELAHSIDSLYKFLWDVYADWFVEYLKTDTTQIPFAKELFRQYIVLLSPYAPFETEVLWQDFFGESQPLAFTKHEQSWAKNQLQSNSHTSSDEFVQVINFIQSVRSLRGLFAIDPVNLLEVFTKSKVLDHYSEFLKLAGRVTTQHGVRPELYTINQGEVSFSLNILDYISDPVAELKRTEKVIQGLEKQIEALQTQLTNEKFLAGAEPEIIEQKKSDVFARLVELEAQKGKVKFLVK